VADAWGVSWGGTFLVWGASESTSPRSYGPPFADFSLDLTTTIDRFHKMNRDIMVRFTSSRLDINGESEP
jgi:hypothetical protein